MKKQLNEVKKMQHLAGLITESEYQKSLQEANESIKVLKDIFYFDKLNTLAAKDDVDQKYHEDGELWAEKGDVINIDSEEYDMILNSKRLKKGKEYDFSPLSQESIKEDYNKPSVEQVQKYWSIMVDVQPEDVVKILTDLSTGKTSFNDFITSTNDDVFDSFRDELYNDEDNE